MNVRILLVLPAACGGLDGRPPRRVDALTLERGHGPVVRPASFSDADGHL
jgi:hypothetical protein